jgi:hypothetical protein
MIAVSIAIVAIIGMVKCKKKCCIKKKKQPNNKKKTKTNQKEEKAVDAESHEGIEMGANVKSS